jgi:hypothetical protein
VRFDMSTRSLVQLEERRRDEVERASRELVAVRRAHEQALEAQAAAARDQAHHEGVRRAARESFATARTVLALRAAEATLHVAEVARVRARERVERSRALVASTARALGEGEERLRAGEVARRSVARTLEQRAADVSLRMERRSEDENEDAFRAHSYARTPVSPVRR